jgi:hypothetical protein
MLPSVAPKLAPWPDPPDLVNPDDPYDIVTPVSWAEVWDLYDAGWDSVDDLADAALARWNL